ncbi:MAG: NYN domain-containing protein [Candidatus Rokubacteria bacterium]|nr:NYN domain-containing protein [Candidatus Rokubacteria bacterium]
MRWLIDGYNVIRRDPDLRSREAEGLEAGRTALLHLLARVARESTDRFTVVFDGARVRGGGVHPGGRIEPVFSRPPETADDVLMRLATRWREGAIVVTSDRVIRDRARRARCAVLTAEEFLAGLPTSAGGPGEEPFAKEEEDEGDDRARSGPKRGNPRRLGKDARASRRALRRLRGDC